MPIDARIRLEVINDDGQHEKWGVIDLRSPKEYEALVLAFGNGIFNEARVVGETKAGIFFFVNLIERGGFRVGSADHIQSAQLYRAGDACYPENVPFVFIAPIAQNGEYIDFEHYQAELDVFIKAYETGTDTAVNE